MKISDIGMRMDELADELGCPELAGLAEALAEHLDLDERILEGTSLPDHFVATRNNLIVNGSNITFYPAPNPSLTNVTTP